jgi:integrase
MPAAAAATRCTVPPRANASAVRSVPLPSFAVGRLRAYRRDQATRRLAMGTDWHDLDLVCERGDGTPISPGAYTHGFTRLAARTGYDDVRLHDLRHGVATAVAKSGMSSPVATAAMLGHTDPGFTQRTYTHADDEMVTRAAAGLEAAFGS